MAEPGDKRLRGSRLAIFAAIGIAVLLGLVYYFGSMATQPSVASGENADLIPPEQAEDAALD